MKKITLILTVILSVVIVSSCGNATKADNTQTATENASIREIQKAAESGDSTKVTSTTITLTTAEFKKLVMNYDSNPSNWEYLGDKPCIIDFWATWCPPCKVIAPILDDLAKEYAGEIYIYKVDVDKEPELAGAFGIQSIPTLLFIPMTGEPKAEVGAIPKETFKDRIDNFMLAKK